MFKLLLKKELL